MWNASRNKPGASPDEPLAYASAELLQGGAPGLRSRIVVCKLLPLGEPPLDHAHDGRDVFKCARMRLPLQAGDVEHQNLGPRQLASVRFLLWIDVAHSGEPAGDRLREFQRAVILRQKQRET